MARGTFEELITLVLPMLILLIQLINWDSIGFSYIFLVDSASNF